jgi:hypothetical protein
MVVTVVTSVSALFLPATAHDQSIDNDLLPRIAAAALPSSTVLVRVGASEPAQIVVLTTPDGALSMPPVL